MSDLERLWDDYPTGKPPVREILARAAGEQRRHRRLLTRPLLTAVGVTGMAGAFVAGSLVAGGSGGGPGTPAADGPRHVAFQADLKPATSCDALLKVYQERALELVGPWGWGGGGPNPYYSGNRVLEGDMPGSEWASAADRLDGASATMAPGAAPQTERQVNSETGTNVQETGVDEPDTVKTDGTILTMVRDDTLMTYDVTGASTKQLSTITLPGIEGASGAEGEAHAQQKRDRAERRASVHTITTGLTHGRQETTTRTSTASPRPSATAWTCSAPSSCGGTPASPAGSSVS